MSCAICHHRKEKRFCLAVHDRICPQCCGEQRELTLDCPAECPYLQQARQHGWRNQEDYPADEVFPKVEVTQQFVQSHQPLILGITHTIAKTARADRNLNDREVIGALVNMVKSYQTLIGSGLVYQEVVPGLVQQSLVDSIGKLVNEFREVEQRNVGYSRLKDGEVLRALVFVLRVGHSYTTGRPRSRGFLDFLRSQFPESASSIIGEPESPSSIVLP